MYSLKNVANALVDMLITPRSVLSANDYKAAPLSLPILNAYLRSRAISLSLSLAHTRAHTYIPPRKRLFSSVLYNNIPLVIYFFRVLFGSRKLIYVYTRHIYARALKNE